MTDVLVVGAGVAGALLAARLASSGAKVTLLEAGSTMDRAKGVQAYLKSPMKVPESAYAPLPWSSRPDTANRSAYYVQTGPHLFKSTYERRVGGTTWHWLGTSLRLLPSDFQLHSRYGVAIDWPIRYDDLEAWYGQAENELGVAGDSATDLGSPRTTPYPMPKIPQTTVDLAVSKAAQRAGAELLTESVAFCVEVDASGNVSGIRYKKPDGSEHTATARVYLIAAHGIESLRDGPFRRDRGAFRVEIGNDGWAHHPGRRERRSGPAAPPRAR